MNWSVLQYRKNIYESVINLILRKSHEQRRYVFLRKYKLVVSKRVSKLNISEGNSEAKESLTERLQLCESVYMVQKP